MPGVKLGEGNSMNGKAAKRLRRIARELKLSPVSSLAPVGARRTVEIDDKEYEIRRPLALQPCFKRAYREAKKLYTGQARAQTGMVEDLQALGVAPFHRRMVDSTKAQPDRPT
jgi:hypothetical protein